MEYLPHPLSWSQTRRIIQSNQLGKFKRSLDELTKYRQHRAQLKAKGILSLNRLLSDELGWVKVNDKYQIISDVDLRPKSDKLFHHPDDIKITLNRFPYHFTNGITHLLVWTKLPVPNDPNSPSGDISPYTRMIIERYITKKFVEHHGIDRDDVLWFRNWSELQSIKEFSHVHLLIRGLSKEKQQVILDDKEDKAVLTEQDYLMAKL